MTARGLSRDLNDVRTSLSAARTVHGGDQSRMADLANILVVSDLHFGEELLPGASLERRRAVELGASRVPRVPALPHGAPARRPAVAARDRRRPVRLHVGRDPGTPELPGARPPTSAASASAAAPQPASIRMRLICEAHRPLLAELVAVRRRRPRRSTSSSATTTSSCSRPRSSPSCSASSRAAGADDRALARIRVVPWFVYVPGRRVDRARPRLRRGLLVRVQPRADRSARTAG